MKTKVFVLNKPLLLTCLCLLSLVSCVTSSHKHLSKKPLKQDFKSKVGWVVGKCLAIKNPNLTTGTKVNLVQTELPQSIVSTYIVKKTTSEEICPPLMKERSYNKDRGLSFYELRKKGTGIAIIYPSAAPRLVNSLAVADLNNDGANDYFSQCTTGEGLSFGIWGKAPFLGESLWSGYYYLGYDTESTCP